MIQSGKFDSLNMDIKKIANSTSIFLTNRIIEIMGIAISIFGILLLIALISYSPDDPNFIFPENTQIKNLLGFQGSYTSDLFFQSIGLISYLIPITFIFTGIIIFKKKKIIFAIENLVFIVCYSLLGSFFITYFYTDSFSIFINGNGGFIGNYLNNTFLNNLVNYNEQIFYYILIIFLIFLFLLSINFKLKFFLSSIKYLFNIIFNNKEKNYTNKSEIINEYIPQDEIKI